ncbi:MAG: hypothetical protein ACREM3_02665 [Candidatus Rokuibacteriota bacterium]
MAGPRSPGEIGQSYAKLWRILPLAAVMAVVPALLLWVGLAAGRVFVAATGALGLLFFGPALLILLQAVIVPSYLVIDDEGLRFRFYSVELAVPWGAIKEIGPGMGWPALTFHDPRSVVDSATLVGLPPLAWMLAVPTWVVSRIVGRPLANIYPTSKRQLLGMFLANEESFGFHYGMPSSLLEASGRDIMAALRRRRPRA